MDKMTGLEFYNYVLRTFKRDDKATEIYEAVTDTINDIVTRYSFEERKAEGYTDDGIVDGSDYRMDLPEDFGRIIGDVRFADNSSSWTLMKRTKQEFHILYPDPDGPNPITGQPTDYCVFNKQILLGPVPDKTDYFYQMDYSTVPEDPITATTTEVPFTDLFRLVVKFGTLGRIYDDMGEQGLSDRYMAEYENGLEKMKERDRNNTRAPLIMAPSNF